MTYQNLEDKIQQVGNPAIMLRDSAMSTQTGPLTGGEFSNWRDEQTGWRETAALFDLSHHMTDLTLRGPGALPLLSELGIGSLANFPVGKAKQFVAVNADGHVIGDGILDHFADDDINLATMPALANWVQFHVETGGHDVTWSRDEPTASNPLGHPQRYRFQVNGPRALDILEKATGAPVPDIAFFSAGMLIIRGRAVRALGHNMSRAQGYELIGPWADAGRVREALFAAGEEFEMKPNGSRAPTSGTLESGWFPAPLPAVYSGESMKAYREWLPADSYEGVGSLGGSLSSDDIVDYYVTPGDIGYSKLVKFDHDFLGRDALEAAAQVPAPRCKATLVWNTDDVLAVIGSQFRKGLPAKYLEFPQGTYSTWQYDSLTLAGRPVGFSGMVGYTYNERSVLSLAVVDSDVPEGTEVTLLWGEPDGGSAKPQVERHVQTELRATVSRVPFSEVYNK